MINVGPEMTIEKANDILTFPKHYWSRQKEEAQQFAIEVFKTIASRNEFASTRLQLRILMDGSENEE